MSNRINGLKWVQGVASRSVIVTMIALGGLFASAMLASPAVAQLFFSRRLPPGQIISIVQSRGYTYPTYPYYRGDIYVVDANEPRGNRIRLVIDPNSGEIVERLLIRQQRIVPGPGFDDTYVRSGVPRIVNPSEEAINGQPQVRRAPKRTARRPVERTPETTAPIETPATAAPAEPAPQARAPKEPEQAEPISRPTRSAPTAAPAAPVAAAPQPAAAPSATVEAPASGPAERGTKANPRKIGPVLPPAVSVD